MLISDVTSIPLNARPGYESTIVSGKPIASGRVLSMSNDRCNAHIIWSATEGTYAFDPDPITVDIAYIVFGRLIVRQAGEEDQHLGPGTLYEFPRGRFELEVVEPFLKHSTLYNPNGLTLEVETLPPERNGVQ